ncbi:hypothetical protein G5I_11607 [Acromyrmex echinatior]|uniref:Uncharacterized protein n=1 Tax=Acromyrmex echinatior TaxID=103372 RepID=F4X025_ACREC|nr:hypothetical protein G5I_11607 [Acromyrmex echinatior]
MNSDRTLGRSTQNAALAKRPIGAVATSTSVGNSRAERMPGNEAVVPEGWPLTLGGNGLILQLGELEASALRLGECYLCVRSAAVATATATATTSSVSGATTAGEAVEQNTVEIAVVWRTTSMRAPGILGWDREDEFMDWRDLTNKGQPSSSNTASANLSGAQPSSVMKTTGRLRRRSREDARPRTREINRTNSAEHRREEARSIDRLEHQFCRENHTIGESGHTATVMKSRSASSVNTWKDDLNGDEDELDRSTSCRACSKNSSSPIGGDESRAKVKRCTKVVSPTTMEKWKESSRCEIRSRSIASEDLKSPLQFEESVLRRNDIVDDSPKDLEDRLRNAGGPDDISDEDLPAYIGSLLVTVERKIERVSLDDMTFPCPACRNIDTDDPLLGCRCAGDDCGCGEDNCDCSSSVSRKEQSAKSFEVAGIKHIDSDDEEEVRMGFGTKKRVDEVASPRTIHDLPEHVLTCGLSLPVGEAAALSPISWSEPSRAAIALKEVGRSRKRKCRRSQRRAAFTPAGQRGASTTNDRGRSSSGCFERVGLEGINEPAGTVMVFATVTYFLTVAFSASPIEICEKFAEADSCTIEILLSCLIKSNPHMRRVRPRSQVKRRLSDVDVLHRAAQDKVSLRPIDNAFSSDRCTSPDYRHALLTAVQIFHGTNCDARGSPNRRGGGVCIIGAVRMATLIVRKLQAIAVDLFSKWRYSKEQAVARLYLLN